MPGLTEPLTHQPAVPLFVRLNLVRGPGKTAEFVPHEIDDESGVGTQIVAMPVSSKKFPDVVVGNKKGTFYLKHDARKVSKSDWENAQPKVAGR